MSDQKKIFISYSWDSPDHRKWVKKFSDDLQACLGEYFKVLLDQNQKRGTSLSRFMKLGLKDAVKVLIIGTPKYKEKSEANGGVAYETMVITNEMMLDMDTTKFYPILRSGTFETSFPTDIKDRMGDDFSDDKYYEENLEIVVKEIINEYPIHAIIKQDSTQETTDKVIELQKGKSKKKLEKSAKVTKQTIASLYGVLFSEDKTELTYVPKNKIGSFFIPNSVTKIGLSAFKDCTDLTSIEIPNSVTVIEERAFQNCTNLTSVKIPNYVTEIGDLAFADCSNLTSMKIPNSVTEIGVGVFFGCTNLTSVKIPNSVTEIGIHAFKCCMSLSNIVIPDSVTKIAHSAFYQCTSLTSIEIPKSVTEIGDCVFEGCTCLASIIIPDSVTKIGVSVFFGCTNLVDLHLRHKEPIDISASLEGLDLSKITIYVPKGSIGAYRKIDFYKKFKDIIEE